jgi:hypothetical protein
VEAAEEAPTHVQGLRETKPPIAKELQCFDGLAYGFAQAF